MKLIHNVCMHPHCWEFECEMCQYFNPKLFGIIPLPKKLGSHIMGIEEYVFLKRYFKKHPDCGPSEEDEF